MLSDGLIFVGIIYDQSGTLHPWMVKAGFDGSMFWHWIGVNQATLIAPLALTALSDGSALIACNDYSTSAQTMRIIKITPQGSQEWSRAYSDSARPAAILALPDNSLVIGGSIWRGGDYNMLLMKTRPAQDRVSGSALLPESVPLTSFPNPFNPSTTLSFSLPHASRTRLAVFNILGREIAVLTDKIYPAGEHKLIFGGSSLPSGIYFARLYSGDYTATHKLLLLK